MERMLALYIHTSGRCVLYANELFAIPPQEDLELLLHTDSDDPAALLAAGVAPGRLGIDKSWPSKFLIRVLEARPDVAPVLGSAPVDEARMIKDEAEIAAMRRASRINDQVVGQAIAALHAGASETEIADLVERLFREKGANRSSEGQLVCFGPNGADPHHCLLYTSSSEMTPWGRLYAASLFSAANLPSLGAKPQCPPITVLHRPATARWFRPRSALSPWPEA